MNAAPQLAMATDAERYVAVFRIFDALSACGEPEELARVLADQLRDLISFDHLDALIFKENSNEIEWQGWGTEAIALPEVASHSLAVVSALAVRIRAPSGLNAARRTLS